MLIKTQTNANRRYHQRIFPRIFLIKSYLLHDFFTAHRDSFLLNIKFLGQTFRITLKPSAAPDDEYRADRFISVQLFYLIGDKLCHIPNDRQRYFRDFFAGNGLRQSHNILILYRFFFARFPFDFLCGLKIYKAMLCNNLRQRISRNRNHAICDDAAVFRNGNIRCTRANIHECNI